MSPEFHIIIPARYQSSRLPGKLLMDIRGQTVLERVYRQAAQAGAASITIATDHAEIIRLCEQIGVDCFFSEIPHQSGTDRIAEVVREKQFSDQAIIVNVQGDEPFIPVALIQQAALLLAENPEPVATLCYPIENRVDFINPNVVKVVRDQADRALYFSRAPIPVNRDDPDILVEAYRHIGLYAYRAGFLLDYVTWPSCALERGECLEQLRVLWAGHAIRVGTACEAPRQDINTAEDLANARSLV